MPLDANGYTKKRLEEIKSDQITRLREEFGNEFLTDDKQVVIKLLSPIWEAIALLYEGNEAAYFSRYRSTATGTSLDNVGAITGTTRQAATSSLAVCYARGTKDTVVPGGGRIGQSETSVFFVIRDDFTIIHDQLSVSSLTHSAGTATCTTSVAHGYSDNDFVWISGADQEEYNGLFQIDNVTSTTFDFTVDSGAVSPATGTIQAQKGTSFITDSEEKGEIEALAGTLTQIETAVSGFDQVSNGEDATLGQTTETDAEYRASQEAGLSALGNATFEAIKGAIEQVTGVTSVKLFVNDTKLVDSNGLPASSFKALVSGGLDQDVGQAIFDSKSVGIEAFGNVNVVIVDSQGENQTVSFSRLTEIDIYIEITITKNLDANEGPVFGDEATETARIKANLTSYGAGLVAGQDVIPDPYLIANAISGVNGIASMTLYADDAASPTTDTPIAISLTEVADIDSARINVTYTN